MQNEKQIIEDRLNEIRKYREEAGMNREIVIAGGEAVLKDNAEEFKALKKMQEILDDKLRQSTEFEYLEERKKTKLPKLTQEQEKNFINPEQQKKQERDEVEARMTSILSTARMAGKGNTFETASDGKLVIRENREEYEKLIKMKKIIDDNFNIKDYYEYMKLREETELGLMNEDKYKILMDREYTDKKDFSKVMEEETTDSKITIDDKEEDIENDNPIISSPPTSVDPTKQKSNPSKNFNNILPMPLGEQGLYNPLSQDADKLTQDDNPLALPPRDTDQNSGDHQNEEEIIEIVKITPWQWIKDHKKQILIALGITALTITTIIVLTQLLPAIMAAIEASEVAGLAAEMVTNGQLWHTAIASEQLALHGANTALADVITSISGVANSYNTATGIWTLGAQALPEFASSTALAAEAALAKVTALTNISTIAGVGGLGALGTGLLIPKKKSQTYHSIKNMIDRFKSTIDILTEKDKATTTENIRKQIMESKDLSSSERTILLKKLQKSIKAKLKNQTNEVITEELANEIPKLEEFSHSEQEERTI